MTVVLDCRHKTHNLRGKFLSYMQVWQVGLNQRLE